MQAIQFHLRDPARVAGSGATTNTGAPSKRSSGGKATNLRTAGQTGSERSRRRDPSLYSAKGPVSRILFYAVIPLGATLPPTLISDLPGGFDSSRGARVNRLNASGRYATPRVHSRAFPSLFGLAPCGVYPASVITAGAVRSYRTFSPLPRAVAPDPETWDRHRGGIFSVALAVYGP